MGVVSLRSRRDILRLAGNVAVGALVGGGQAFGARRPSDRTLAFYSVHSGERLSVAYFSGGRYQPDALGAVSRLLRDHVTEQTHVIDPTLLDQLHRLRTALDPREPFHVVCGYRSPETNAMERRRRGGIASHSMHIEGRAVDLFLPDRRLEDLRSAALRLGAGGVGYYPASGFVHLDTGPVRTW
jgi:uncharacterized protein YcbK (DUF882 family)